MLYFVVIFWVRQWLTVALVLLVCCFVFGTLQLLECRLGWLFVPGCLFVCWLSDLFGVLGDLGF